MVEKKGNFNRKRLILLTTVFGLGILGFLSVTRWMNEGNLTSFLDSWTLISTRGYYGDTKNLSHLPGSPAYSLELLGDSMYRRGENIRAIEAYSGALAIKPDTYIELKMALLQAQRSESGSTVETLTGITKSIIDESITRIEKDTSLRGKYFGTKDTYNNLPPIFESHEKNIIDW